MGNNILSALHLGVEAGWKCPLYSTKVRQRVTSGLNLPNEDQQTPCLKPSTADACCSQSTRALITAID